MKNKNRIRTNNRRTIFRAFPRFISLMVMSLLGVFVFAGLMATAPDMITTLDNYLDDTDSYDIRIISDMGLMEEDIAALGEVEGVEAAAGGKSLDIVVPDGDNELVIQCNTITEGINTPEVKQGHLPEAADEIAVESAYLEEHELKLGDTITTESSSLQEQTMTIVGEVVSPLYYNSLSTTHERGSTSVGKGSIDYYAYISEENLDFDYYTVIYLRVQGAEELVTSEDDYVELVEQVRDRIEAISQSREQARYDSIIEDAEQQIQDAEDEAYQELDDTWEELKTQIEAMIEGKKQLDDADLELASNKEELDSARSQLDSAQQELSDAGEKLAAAEKQLDFSADELAASKSKLDAAEKQLKESRSQLDSYKEQLADAKAQLDSAKKQLDSSKQTLDENEKKLTAAKAELDDAKKQLDAARAQLDEGQAQYDQALSDAGITESEAETLANTLDTSITAAKATISVCDAAIASLDEQIAACDDSVVGQIQKTALEARRQEQVRVRANAESTLDQLNEQSSDIKKLQSAKKQLEAGEAEYQTKKAQYDSAEAEYEAGKQQWDEGKARYDQGVKDYESGLAAYNEQMAEYEAAEKKYQEGLKEYQAGKKAYESGVSQYESGKKEYEEGKAEYDSSKKEYESGEAQYKAGLAAWEEGQAAYESGKQTYEENLNKYKNSSGDYDVSIIDLNQDFDSMEEAETLYEDAKADIASQIEESRAKLADVEMPTWYIYDREGYSVYGDYIDAATSMRNLAGVFPPIFFAVAVLVSLISMNRMVEEDRMEIGTMKSMGFENRHIRTKYTGFSLWATIVGGVIGAAGGLVIIPSLIYNIYHLLFETPDLILTLQPVTTLLGFFITVLCVCGTSAFTVAQVLKEKPSELMRPKAPKNGKRILLERIPAIWNHMSFSQKITVRNLFRYKKRVLITIGGIAGCTTLMLTGFGIHDSITDLPSAQYDEIYHYDGMAIVNQLVPEDFMNESGITDAYSVQQISATALDQSIYIFVAEDYESMADLASLCDSATGEELLLEEGKIIVTEKFATITGVKVGDELSFVDVDNNTYHLEISGIVDNYIYHYIYMTSETYESLGHTFSPNLVYFNTGDISEEEKDQLAERLLSTGDILSIQYKTALLKSTSNMLGSMNSVVIILLVLAAMLFFVVLYNLANININERRREIATLKVLGFYDREVDQYITRENVFMTGLGILIGLALGVFVSHMVVLSIEIDLCRFINHLQPLSYVYTALFAILFTWIVNIIIHFNLKRINMIDSLKSVE